MCRIFYFILGNSAQPLYYTASIGLSQIIENMMIQMVDVNAVEGPHCIALQAASVGGHEKVIQILLEAGADVKAEEGHYGNVCCASLHDLRAVVSSFA